MKKIKKNEMGFTLMELLISISIFMVFLALAAGSYVSLVKANRQANEMQKLYREVRFVFDTLAQEIRGGALDYSCIDNTRLDALCLENQNSDEKTVLSVLGKDGAARSIYKFDAAHKKLFVMKNANNWEELTSANFPLEELHFTISPLQNPYESANAALDAVQIQPAVTIYLTAAGFGFRTTYSSRAYGKQPLYAAL